MEQNISKIKEQVEQRLQEQQANKDFKDIGRVAQTKKEKSAFRLINGSVLNQLEEDGVMAYNMVKKDAVWAEIDVQMERDKGVTSGAAYLKVKIREAVPTRPKDEKAKRATYVMFLELLQNDLLECFNVEQIKQLSDKYRNLPIDKIIGYFFDNSYLTADAETKLKIESHLKTNNNLRLAMLYGGSSLVKKLINEVFGARFENILFQISDAAYQVWNEAKEKEPITEEQSKELVEKLEKSEKAFVESNDKKIEDYKLKSKEELWKSINTEWQIGSENKKRYKENTEWFRDWVISYYEKRKEKGITDYKFKILLAQPKPNDWSWFETPKTKDSTEDKKPKEKAINTKEPLAYIKRTGGYKIENYSPKGIVDIFGFNAVNYGNYVDNAWSKEHTKHFLGAICDMAEMLNIDIKKTNQLGKLSIAFGAKGIKGHLATYFPQTKDINLTKGNGDGSVAHEWGHYFDNVIVELDEKKATNSFASDGLMPDFEIKGLYKELMDFIYKGNDLYTPKVPMLFYAEKSDKAPTYIIRNGYQSEQKTVEIKETIEETLAELDKYAVVSVDWYYTQKRLFGYVIAAFGLETYNVPMKLKTSYFYHTSAYSLFQYCKKIDDKKIEIAVKQRTKYWSSAVELFARAWETVMLKKLLDKNRVSNYLVNDIPLEIIVSENYYRPYPQGKELEYIETIMDKIVAAVKRKFDIGDFVAPSYVIEDDYVELKKDESGKTENAMVVDKVEDKKEIEFVKEDEVVATIETTEEDTKLLEIEKNIQESIKEEAEINAIQDPTKRLSILKESLRKKEELFNQKIQEHFDTVRQANGQPLNDKRNGQATLNKWERQNDAIRNIKESIEKTKNAIQIEEGKIKQVSATKEYLPKQLLDAINNGTIVQWRKHPNTFFVAGVDKARLVWDNKDKVLAYRYIREVTDKDQYKKFAKTYNELYNAIKNNIDLGVKTEEMPKENVVEVTPKNYNIGDEFMLGEDKVYIGENGAFGLKDEVCLYNSSDKSLFKCIGEKSFEEYLKEGKITPIQKEVIPQKVVDAFETEPKEGNFSFIRLNKQMWRRDNRSGEITNQGDAPEFTLPKGKPNEIEEFKSKFVNNFPHYETNTFSLNSLVSFSVRMQHFDRKDVILGKNKSTSIGYKITYINLSNPKNPIKIVENYGTQDEAYERAFELYKKYLENENGFVNKDLDLAFKSFENWQIKKANKDFSDKKANEYYINIPQYDNENSQGSVYTYSNANDREKDFELLKSKNEKQTIEVHKPTEVESIADTKSNKVGSETKEGENETIEKRFEMPIANDLAQFEKNIDKILWSYSHRKMASIQVFSYFASVSKDLQKQWADKHNIKTKEQAEKYFANRQSKVRKETIAKDKKESREFKAELAVENIIKIAEEQSAKWDKMIEESEETKPAEPTNDNESILKKIKALQILANMGDESATKKVKALKLLIN